MATELEDYITAHNLTMTLTQKGPAADEDANRRTRYRIRISWDGATPRPYMYYQNEAVLTDPSLADILKRLGNEAVDGKLTYDEFIAKRGLPDNVNKMRLFMRCRLTYHKMVRQFGEPMTLEIAAQRHNPA